MQIQIIGTSHIAKESVDEITKAISKGQPDIVAVELDLQRATALMQDQKSKVGIRAMAQIGAKGYLFAKIAGFVQQKLGKMVGVSPGSDMKTAIQQASKLKKEIVLIDQPIQITLAKLSKAITWKERFRFMGDIVKGVFQPKKEFKKLGLAHLDLRKVPEKELIEKMMGHMKDRYPSIYKVLVSDRNRYMVKQLVKVARKHPGMKCLVVVGAGHVEGMKELLLKVDIV